MTERTRFSQDMLETIAVVQSGTWIPSFDGESPPDNTWVLMLGCPLDKAAIDDSFVCIDPGKEYLFVGQVRTYDGVSKSYYAVSGARVGFAAWFKVDKLPSRLPCSNCDRSRVDIVSDSVEKIFYVCCARCHIRGPIAPDVESAIYKWNKLVG